MSRAVIAVGEPNVPHFAELLSWLVDRSQLMIARSSAEACQRAGESASPDLILLLQSRPGQFQTAEVEHLHRVWPLARIIMALGSWCEGEARSGKPISGTWRIYWYDFVRRIWPLFESGQATPPKSWCLPRSANDTDRLLSDLCEPVRPQRGLAAIVAHSRDAYESLSDACRAVELETVWHGNADASLPSNVRAGIWDARYGDEHEVAEIRGFARTLQPAKVVVIQGFPRSNFIHELTAAGVRALAKPFQLPDLWRALDATGTIG